jgi:hypothetical protein
MVHGRILPIYGRSLPIQTGLGTRTRQDPIHTPQHGTSLLFPDSGLLSDVQNLPGGIFEIMQGYMKYGSTFNIEGSEF